MNFDFKLIYLSYGYICLINDMYYFWFVDNLDIVSFYLVIIN